MDEIQLKQWVKDKANKDRIVANFFNRWRPNKDRMAIFIAGIPGAGKTEFIQHLNLSNIAIIEHDKLVEELPDYQPSNYYLYRAPASVLVSDILKTCFKEGYSFMLDDTLANPRGHSNIKYALKNQFNIRVIYIIKDINKAWQFTLDRKLIEKRSIDKQGFIDTCNGINSNLLSIYQDFAYLPNFSFDIIDKRQTDWSKQYLRLNYSDKQSLKIEQILQMTYNSETIK